MGTTQTIEGMLERISSELSCNFCEDETEIILKSVNDACRDMILNQFMILSGNVAKFSLEAETMIVDAGRRIADRKV